MNPPVGVMTTGYVMTGDDRDVMTESVGLRFRVGAAYLNYARKDFAGHPRPPRPGSGRMVQVPFGMATSTQTRTAQTWLVQAICVQSFALHERKTDGLVVCVMAASVRALCVDVTRYRLAA